MQNLKTKAKLILTELGEQISHLVGQGQLDSAGFFLDQYIKLSPTSVDRYSLEAMVQAGAGDYAQATETLKEGLALHPLSFDLLYNLGYLLEEQQDYLEAYHIYMKARYVAAAEPEQKDIIAAFTRLKRKGKGQVDLQEGKVFNIVTIGAEKFTLASAWDELLQRKEHLASIERNLACNLETILEIGFGDGIISKNLNYFGYEVTAVDPVKENMLHVIAREHHDNIIQPGQKVAKFYIEPVDLDWLKKIPCFDAIIAVGPNNLTTFACWESDTFSPESEPQNLLQLLLKKANKQLFLRVSTEPAPLEFNKADLIEAAAPYNAAVKVIASGNDQDGHKFQLCSVTKPPEPKPFSVPLGSGALDSTSTILEVEMDRLTDSFGAGYIHDWHHFVQALKQYETDPELQYEKSVLKDYYDRFQPRNLEESLFARPGRAPKLRRGWIAYPWFGNSGLKVGFSRKRGETRPGGNHHFGPNTTEFGQAELGRLIHLYKLFNQTGYHPELFSDGYISGYLLVKNQDYRFVITEGQHRIACLAALGYKRIRCRFTQKPHYPQIVKWDDLKNWPQVANGVYSRNQAQKVFNRFFAHGVGKQRLETKR